MRTAARAAALVLTLGLAGPAPAEPARPLALHPENPHYFLFRGKPAVLITSTEHYGAVLNRNFDYVPYLNELHARGFNLTRTFSGVYREVPGSFGITENTLGPPADRWLCPWARGDEPGAGDGNKFDLKRWDPAYFDRLRDFVAQAGRRGIVVELVLFCTIYDDKLWAVNPMNPANNRQGIGPASRLEVYTGKDRELLAVQEALVRKIAAELRDCDNVYYEVCNEPYFGGVTPEWTDRIVAALVDAESAAPAPHLIAQNIANGSAEIKKPNPHVSIFNFHYATPPQTVALNYGLGKALADDETGFRGQADLPYRTEAWDFLLAGGAVYDNLDYSFTATHPDGTAKVTTSPGGGGPGLRRQLKVLKDFMDGLDFVHMKPDNAVVKGGRVTAGLAGNPPEAQVTARALVEPGKTYAVYVRGGSRADLALNLPAGSYRAEWLDTKTGETAKAEEFEHGGGQKMLASPEYSDDIILRIKRAEGKR
jgi:hypothetical protein